ncbi:MAG: hypothetical protein IM604_12090, partial [Cytophagales bacterium]|nr:hypothetical protein [Cytophagales bacterium]
MKRIFTTIGTLLVFLLTGSVALAQTVTSVTSTSNAFYRAGQTVSITVTFSEEIDFVPGTGGVELALNAGGVAKATRTTGASGTSTLVLTYTVAATENATPLNYSATNSLTLTGGATIKKASDVTDATLTLPALVSTNALQASNVTIDTNAPTISNVSIPNAAMKVGSLVTATITVGDDGGQTYTLSSGTIGGFTLGSFTRTNSTTYTAQFTVTNGGTDVPAASNIPVSLIIADPATNPSATYATPISQAGDPIDANLPTISNVSIPNAAMKVGSLVTATITVGDDGGQTYTLTSGTIGGFTLGSFTRTNSTTYTAQFTVT